MCKKKVFVAFICTEIFLANMAYSRFENDYPLRANSISNSSSTLSNVFSVAPQPQFPIGKIYQDSTSKNYVLALTGKHETEGLQTAGRRYQYANDRYSLRDLLYQLKNPNSIERQTLGELFSQEHFIVSQCINKT